MLIAVFFRSATDGNARKPNFQAALNEALNVAQEQAELTLPSPKYVEEESEQEAEARHAAALLRQMEDAADEVGRDVVCYALHFTEGTLSKKLRGELCADARLLAYLLKKQKSQRLAKWLARYANFLPFQREEQIDADAAMREVVSLALAGEVGNAAKEKILSIYQRVKKDGSR